MAQNKKQEPSANDDKRERFKDEVTKNKIDRHLIDINDSISEEDIKNIITDISSTRASTYENKKTPGQEQEEQLDKDKPDNDKEDVKKDLPTSWNILE